MIRTQSIDGFIDDEWCGHKWQKQLFCWKPYIPFFVSQNHSYKVPKK